MSGTGLATYDQARTALATCVEVDEAKEIRDKAEALRVYGIQSKDNDLEMWAAEIKLRANRRIGEISQSLEKSKGGTNPSSTLPTGVQSKHKVLEEAGISRGVAHRAEQVAAIPKEEFEEFIAENKAEKKPPHTMSILKRAKNGKPAAEKPEPTGRATRESVKDGKGREVPADIAEHFDAGEGLVKTVKAVLAGLLDTIQAASAQPWGAALTGTIQAIEIDAKNIREAVRCGVPYVVCPHADEDGKHANASKCKVCQGRGWVTRGTYDQLSAALKETCEQWAEGVEE